MREFSPKGRVFASLRGEGVDRPPVTSIGGCEGTLIVDVQKATGIYLPDAVKEETRKALEAGVDLIEAGEGILLPTPLGNIKAMVETVKGWKTSL